MTQTAVEALTESMDHLMRLMEEEAGLAAAGDIDGVRSLIERKQALGRAYEDAARTLRLDHQAQAALDADTKAALRDKAALFQAALLDNANRLKARVELGQIVVDAIVAAYNDQRLQETGYSPPKASPRRTSGVTRYATAAPATLNQTL